MGLFVRKATYVLLTERSFPATAGFPWFSSGLSFAGKMQDEVHWMHGISSVLSYFTLCNRVGDGKGEQESLCGVCEHMHARVDRERCMMRKENGIFYPGFS